MWMCTNESMHGHPDSACFHSTSTTSERGERDSATERERERKREREREKKRKEKKRKRNSVDVLT